MIKVGIGGWSFEPWRGVFFPEGLSKAKELHHASRRVTAIEVNATFYSTFSANTYKKWAGEVPDDFVFALKGPRYAVNRKVLAEAGASVTRFIDSGISELKGKLGPLLWQLAGTKKYDPDDIEAFLNLLPRTVDGVKLRHVLEVRHKSFCVPEFIAQLRKHDVATVLAHSDDYPLIADLSTDFVYLRLQNAQAEIETGYAVTDLKTWGARAQAWEAGGAPADLPLLAPAAEKMKRDVFMFFIAGAKERNPAAAEAMLNILSER